MRTDDEKKLNLKPQELKYVNNSIAVFFTLLRGSDRQEPSFRQIILTRVTRLELKI